MSSDAKQYSKTVQLLQRAGFKIEPQTQVWELRGPNGVLRGAFSVEVVMKNPTTIALALRSRGLV